MYCIKIGGIPNVRDSIWRDGFFAVTFLNGFSSKHINPWMNWYVGDLVIFLSIAPFLKKLIDTSKKAVLLFFISILIAGFSTAILKRFGAYDGWYFYFWFPNQFPLLVLGIVFYFFNKESLKNIKNSIYTLMFIISFGFLLEKSEKPIMETHVEYGILLVAFTYTLFSKVETGTLFNWLKALGNNSYGIYLYHGCLLPGISNMVKKSGAYQNILSFYFVLPFIIGHIIFLFKGFKCHFRKTFL